MRLQRIYSACVINIIITRDDGDTHIRLSHRHYFRDYCTDSDILTVTSVWQLWSYRLRTSNRQSFESLLNICKVTKF